MCDRREMFVHPIEIPYQDTYAAGLTNAPFLLTKQVTLVSMKVMPFVD